MAGGIDWFRWHHGSVTDPKFQLVARKAQARFGDVMTVWACLLEHGGQHGSRVAAFDFEATDALLGLARGKSMCIYLELAERGLIADGAIANPRRYYPAVTMRPSGGLWAAIRVSVFERDKHTCQYCGVKSARLECDHVIPVANGGSHDEGNLKTACQPCNRSKGAKLLSEWKR